MDAVELLTLQHRTIESGLKAALESTTDQERAAWLAEIGDHLTVHIAAEEQVFYPAVHACRTENVLLEALEEHLSLKRLLADLIALPPSAQTFGPKLEVLKEQAEHHHHEEEEDLFPKACKLIDAAERDSLGQRMLALQQEMQRLGDPRERVADEVDRAAPLE